MAPPFRISSNLDEKVQHQWRQRRRFLIGLVIWFLGWELIGQLCLYFGWLGF